MIIDFHTHIFPEKIAKKTIDHLSEKGGIPPFSDGSVSGLLSNMKKAGISLSVTLPVLTSPTQFDSVNRFALEVNKTYANGSERLISFAGIHPACEEIDKKMAFIKENGFLGVKIHPDYQGTFIDDDGYVKILEEAKKNDLIVVSHAGVDCGFPDQPVRCTPDRALKLIRRVPYSKLVLAHYGGIEMFDQVYDTLCGEDVYFDTSYILRFISKETFLKILEKHGEDRILFASDSPWSDAGADQNILRSFSLNKTTEEKIFWKNAEALLGIKVNI